MKTPSDELTEIILPLLIESKLLLPDDAERYKAKLAAGTMKPEDWLLAVEKALDKDCRK